LIARHFVAGHFFDKLFYASGGQSERSKIGAAVNCFARRGVVFMPAVYDRMGIQFQYPENWTLDEGEALVERNSVSLHSPDGAIWSVLIYPPNADPAKLAADALAAIQSEYDNMDVELKSEMLADQRLEGFDLNFFYLDLTSTATIRALQTPRMTLVVHCQAEDREFARLEAVFRAITTSLLQSS
jgi:hypothetical protein